MKQSLAILVSIAVIVTALLWLLSSIVTKSNHQQNSFIRLLPPHATDSILSIMLPNSSFYPVSMNKYEIWFHEAKVGSNMSYRLKERTLQNRPGSPVQSDLVVGENVNYSISRIDGTIEMTQDKNRSVYQPVLKLRDYTAFSAINDTSIVYRFPSSDFNKNILALSNFTDSSTIMNDSVLEKQIDGVFCTDGSLHYSNALDIVVYVYSYRNEYLILNRGLVLKQKGKTIDTTARASLKVTRLKDRITLSAPPLVINRVSRVAGNKLYILSDRMAANEFASRWKELSVIDVYDISNQTYKYSFYVLNQNKTKLTSFLVDDQHLLVQFGSMHTLFKLNLNID
jgi:hypothetical protein